MTKIFRGRVYLGNAWPFYLLFVLFLVVGLSFYFEYFHFTLEVNYLTSRKLGFIMTLVSSIVLPWMILANLNVGKWYTVDDEGISLIRFGFVFRKFYFKDISSLAQLSTEETKELLFKEYAPSLMFRRAPMEKSVKTLFSKVPKAWEVSTDLNNLIRFSTVPILVGGIGTGYQYPIVEDSKKTFRFSTKGPFVLVTTKENKHILISPKNIDEFLDVCNQVQK